MEFFDRKEDVIDIQLTPYGKSKLLEGVLKPAYYSFHDNDVVYSYKHANLNENVGEIHDRIVEYPRIRPPYKFFGEEKNTLGTVSGRMGEITSPEREYVHGLSLGTSEMDEKLPSWELLFLSGKISYSTNTLTSSLGELPIPQIHLTNPTIKTRVVKVEPFEDAKSNVDSCDNENFSQVTFEDNSGISVTNEPILLQIVEKNVQSGRENFELELFEVVNNDLIPLYFQKERNNIVDDLIVDVEDDYFGEVDHQMVDYFFEILADSQIDDERLCESYNSENSIYNYDNARCTQDKDKIEKSSQNYKFRDDSGKEC